MISGTPVIDAQVHCFERDHPGRPWTGPGSPLLEAPGRQAVDRMDEAGVDSAVLVSPWLNYLADPSYAFDVATAYPGRFAVVAPIDLTRPDPAGIVQEVTQHPYGAALRHVLWNPTARAAVRDGALDPVLTEMEAAALPLCLALGAGTAEAVSIATRFPLLTVVIDHLGLPASPIPPAPPAPFAALADTLALAVHPNVFVKATGMPALSHQPFPYADLRNPLRRLVDVFGPARVLWGTDWTRVHAFQTYREGVDWIVDAGLSPEELARIRGLNAFELFFRARGWQSS